jgi:quinol monooxygenase YgiN
VCLEKIKRKESYMFVLAVKLSVIKGKEEELIRLLSEAIVKVRKNEKDTLMYDLHRKIGDPSEMFFYERYSDRQAWEVSHMSKPYIKELIDALPNYLKSDIEITEYETIELK